MKITKSMVKKAGAVALATTLIGTAIKMRHWFEINFEMVSYPPQLVILSWVGWIASFMVALSIRKKTQRYFYILLSCIYLVSNAIFTYGIAKTYGMKSIIMLLIGG